MLSTINLEDIPSLDIFRFAGAQAKKGFGEKPKKLDTPCEFFRKNKLSSFRYRVLEKGDVRLSVITPSGSEHYAIQRNFILAYIKLVRSYYSLKID
ncbi:hypothetical protein ACVVIH_06860 [Chryseobacterium arthrosphaerae]